MDETRKLILSPTLVIGIGGTGSLGVQWAKKSIEKYLRSYGLFKASPIEIDAFQFLSVDTAYQSTFVKRLAEKEIFNLGGVNPLQVIRNKEIIHNYAKAYQWLPRELRTGQLSTGAGGERLLGRLSLFEKQQKLQGVLRQKIDTAQKAEIDSIISRSYQDIELKRDHLNVHIICSLAGGTGSACLLDTAYLIRHTAGTTNVDISAHLVTYEPFTERGLLGRTGEKYAKRNFIVTLSEIERFTDFKIGSEDWHAFYPDGTEITSQQAAFDNTYILGYKNMTSLSVNNICEIIGESIALLTARPEGGSHIQALRNHQQSQGTDKDGRRQNKLYSSYKIAIASCELDEDWVRFYVKQIIIESFRTSQGGSPKLIQKTSDELKRLFDFEDTLDDGAKLQFKMLDFFRDEKAFFKSIESQIRYITHKKSDEKSKAPGKIESYLSSVRRKKQPSPDDRKLDELSAGSRRNIETVFRNAAIVVRRFEEELRETLDKEIFMLVTKTGSIKILSNMLDKLLKYLVGEQAEERTYREELYKESIERKNQTLKQYVEGELPKLKKQIESLCEGVRDYLEDLKFKCETADKFLFHFGSEQRGDYSPSGVSDTVWIPEQIKQILTDKKDNIVKNFIETLNNHSASAGSRAMEFLDYLKDGLANEQIIMEAIDLVSKTVKKEFYNFERSLNQVKDETVESLYRKSTPAWIADGEGTVFENIVTTNVPEESMYYDKLQKIASRDLCSIKKSKRDFELDAQLMVFQSEHYASASQLHAFREAARFVESILASDGKNLDDIGEFSLDKRWGIKLPVPDKTISQLRLNFTLGFLFGKIKFDSSRNTHIFDGVHLKQVEHRFLAFEKYVQDYLDKDAHTRHLFSLIDNKREEEEAADILLFAEKIKAEYRTITELMEEERKGSDAETIRRENYQLLEEKEDLEIYANQLEDRYRREKIEGNGNLTEKLK